MYESFYVIYLNLKEGSVIFSSPFSSFSQSKENINNLIEDYAKKISKSVKYVSKEELEKLKISKKLEDFLYVRKKDSSAIIYCANISTGTFYNSYNLEKYAHVGINDFRINFETPQNKEFKNSSILTEYGQRNIHITNKERGSHVNVITELKKVLENKRNIPMVSEEKKELHNDNMSIFISDLVEGKKKLKKVTPPVIKKYF